MTETGHDHTLCRDAQAVILREAAEAWGEGQEGFPYAWLMRRAQEIEDGQEPTWNDPELH